MLAKTLLLAVIVVLFGPLAAAQGFDSPKCNEDYIKARPGVDRTFRMWCWHTDRIALATPPETGALTQLKLDPDSGKVTWHFEPRAGAADTDYFELEVTGPAGTLRHRVDIRNVPRDVNTAPVCEPVRHAERTDGSGPAELEFHVYCWDEEYDEMVIEGGGPGEHLSMPVASDTAGFGSRAVPLIRYRTKVSTGEEQASYWGTDVMGARSEEAPISLTFGPGVDRLPECVPNPSSYGFEAEHLPILARPGVTRRFPIVCSDADGDSFVPRLGTLPSHGVIASFLPGPERHWLWGVDRWIDATYVPSGDHVGEDPFTVIATGLKGESEMSMAMVTRPLPDNGGGGCQGSGGRTLPGVPTVLSLLCDDNDGDKLSATVTEGPLHGIAGVPVLTPSLFGYEDIAIPYTPRPGFTGVDLVEVTVVDGNGLEMVALVDVYVEPEMLPVPVPEPGPLPTPEPLPTPDPSATPGPSPTPEPEPEPSPTPDLRPSGPPDSGLGAPPPVRAPLVIGPTSFARPGAPPPPPAILDAPAPGQAPARSPEDQARRVLATKSVKLVRRIGVARLYSAARRRGGRPKLALTCALRCTVRIEPTGRSARSSRRVTARPGRATRITLRPTRSDRRKGRVVVGLTVSDAAGSRRTARLRVGL